MAKNIVISILSVILIISIGGAFYSSGIFSKNVPSLEETISKSLENFGNIQTFHYEFILEYKGWQKIEDEEQIKKPETKIPFSNLFASIKNALVLKPSSCKDNPKKEICQTESSYDFSLNINQDIDLKDKAKTKDIITLKSVGPSPGDPKKNIEYFTIKISAINIGGDKSYLKLDDFELSQEAISNSEVDLISEQINSLKGKWFYYNLTEAQKLEQGIWDFSMTDEEKEIQKLQLKLSEKFEEKLRKEIEENIKKDFSLSKTEKNNILSFIPSAFNISASLKNEDNKQVYFYEIETKKDGLKKFLGELIDVYLDKSLVFLKEFMEDFEKEVAEIMKNPEQIITNEEFPLLAKKLETINKEELQEILLGEDTLIKNFEKYLKDFEANLPETKKSAKEQVNNFLEEFFVTANAEVSFTKKDLLPNRIKLDFEFKDPQNPKGEQYYVVLSESKFSNFNQKMSIQEPEGAQSIVDIYNEMFSIPTTNIPATNIPDSSMWGIMSTPTPDIVSTPTISPTPDLSVEAAKDSDNDGLTDTEEKCLGTDFEKFDTDGDGFSDFSEIKDCFDPLISGYGVKLNQGRCIELQRNCISPLKLK